MKLQSRGILDRFARIADHCRRGQLFNARTLSADLGVSEKTARRDLEFMRDRLGYCFEWLPRNNRFIGHQPQQRIL